MYYKKEFIRAVCIYLITYLVLLVAVLGLLYAYPKPELHMMLNAHHTSCQDTFFKYYTLLAEWPLYVLALATGGVFVQILKHLFSADRPIVVFENYPDMVLPLVEGVELHHSNSFPSGHTSTFFMFFTCMVIVMAYYYCKNDKLHNLKNRVLFYVATLLPLALAALGGYSRIYLSQHFLSDVCVGSIIGDITPFLMFFLLKNKLKIEN